MRRVLVVSLLLAVSVLAPVPGAGAVATTLRFLAINVGNASPQYGCWEYKLCRASDVADIRAYIATWKPDVIVLSEVYRADQLTGTAMNGPLLPSGWTGLCGRSRDRHTGALAAWNAAHASHEHECVAWRTSRLQYVAASALSAYGRNDDYGKSSCDYDFTGFRVRLEFAGIIITAVAVHPNSGEVNCRTNEISRYWSTLADGPRTLIGGDWNTDADAELQLPSTFRVTYRRGEHWNVAHHSSECSAVYLSGALCRQLDHTFTNFGSPCLTCGGSYATPNLAYGSAVATYHGHPRADGGDGMDHRQILVDLTF